MGGLLGFGVSHCGRNNVLEVVEGSTSGGFADSVLGRIQPRLGA